MTGFHVDLWFAVLAPAGTPKDLVAKYNAALNDILRSPPITEKLGKQGLNTAGGPPERLRDFIPKEIEKWQKVVKEAGIAAAE